MYDPNLHLLADNDELTHHWNLTRTIGRPERSVRPLLQADRPWEGEQIACWGTVIHDPSDGLFKIWYQTWIEDFPATHVSRSVICYAQSRDGLTWEKPNLGVTTYQGSTDHNVVYTVEDFDQPHQLDCFAVLHEPEDPDPARRFKMLAWVERIPRVDKIQMGFISLFSADGIRWTRHPGYTIPRLGDRMGCYHDVIRGRYVMNSRQAWRNLRNHLPTKRQVAMAESTDFVEWTEARSIIKLDDDDGMDDQFYGLTPFVWGNQYLGHLEVYHRATEHLDLHLVTSRDGEHWSRPAQRDPFLARGPDGAWDETWVAFTSNPPIVHDDEMWLYYDGRRGGHHPISPPARRHGAVGLARTKRDRFAGLTAGIQEGEAVTERILVGAPRLLLNLNARCGEVVAAVYDAEGDPIEGYGRADCTAVSGDEVDAEITWNGANLGPMESREVYLRFWIRYGTLYAYRFAS